MKRFLLALVALLALAGAGSGALLWSFAHRAGPLLSDTDHVVPHGSTAHIAHDLAQAQIIEAGQLPELAFRALTRLTSSQGPLHAAELHFPAGGSALDVLAVLRHAPPVRHFLTIPEGRTARQIALIIADSPLLAGPVPTLSEGAILPQTIAFERGTSRRQIVQRLEALMTRTLAGVWARREPMPGIASPEQLLVLASMVERETAVNAERPLVARVFLNRLAQGMKLQSDPTAIYDLSGGLGVLDHGVTHEELHRPGPHNTYVIDGLPSGPICSPGLAALEAAAHPAQGDMLYFVADGSGGHGFSHDLREHNQRVDALRALKAGQAKPAAGKPGLGTPEPRAPGKVATPNHP